MEHFTLNQTANSNLEEPYPDAAPPADPCDLPSPHRLPSLTARFGDLASQPAPTWLDLFDPRQPEAFLAFCSLWCSTQMWIWPNEFAAQNALVTLEVGLRGHEQVWAIFGGVAALLKLGGLAARLSASWDRFSSGLLAGGLFMSIIFWMIVGVSRVVDFPHLITPIALTGFGLAAAFQLAGWREPRATWR